MESMKKALHRIQKKTISALLYISEDSFQFTKSPFFNCMKITLFFLQLEGYVFSQYESKPMNLPENIYIAQYTQLSAITFILLQMKIDILTLLFFYLIFAIHILVYCTLIALSFSQNLQKPSYLKKTLNLFFINYQWAFVTPFQEISVGVMVCSSNSFLSNLFNEPNCASDKNKIIYIFGTLATFFVSISGFTISYFFRNYQFNERTFSRQFSLINVVRILIHQFIIILYYINFNNIDYFKHTLSHLLSISLLVDIFINQPFGYSFESKFYSAAAFTHQYLLVLVSLWIFNQDSDKFIFYTLLLILPLLLCISLEEQNRNQSQVLNSISLSDQNDTWLYSQKMDTYLEEIYRNYEESDSSSSSSAKLLFIQIMNEHIKTCNIVGCKCNRSIRTFISHKGINFDNLNEWTTEIFEICLKKCLKAQQIVYYEHLALKYVTFLAKFKNNPINAYIILQYIMKKQTSSNNNSTSFYFRNIQSILSKRNKIEFAQINQNPETDHLRILLKSQSLLLNMGSNLQNQIKNLSSLKSKFWGNFAENKIQSFQQLVEDLKQIENQTEKCKYIANQIKSKQNKSPQILYDSIPLLRLQLLLGITSGNDLKNIQDIDQQIFQIQFSEQQELDLFMNQDFLKDESISLVTYMSKEKRGDLWNPNKKQIQEYFQIKSDIINISQLIPKPFDYLHDGIIENFIQSGDQMIMQNRSMVDVFTQNENKSLVKLQISLSYFFPKFDKDFQFYLIAHMKKVKTHGTDDEQTGYITFDEQLRILGSTRQIEDKLNTKFYWNGIQRQQNIAYYIPSLPLSMYQYYQQLQKLENPLLMNDVIFFRQQENMYYNSALTKYSDQQKYAKIHSTIEQRMNFLQNINEQLQEIDYLNCNPFWSISYNVTQKNIRYIDENTKKNYVYYILQINFLEETKQIPQQPKLSQIMVGHRSDKIESVQFNQIGEHMSLRSRSSGSTYLQNSINLNSQLNRKKLITEFKLLSINQIFLLITLICSIVFISWSINYKYTTKNEEQQSNLITHLQNYYEVINQLNNYFYLPYDDQEMNITINSSFSLNFDYSQKQKIIQNLLSLSIQRFLLIEQPIIMEETEIKLQYIINTNFEIEIQTLQNTQALYQLIRQCMYNIQDLSKTTDFQISQQNKLDLSVLFLNFDIALDIVSLQRYQSFDLIKTKLKEIDKIVLYVLLIIYLCILMSYILHILVVTKILRKRKLFLKLFMRIEYFEALQEEEKFSQIQKSLNGDNIWSHHEFFQSILSSYYQFNNDTTKLQKTIENKGNNRKINAAHTMKIRNQLICISTFYALAMFYVGFLHIFLNQITNTLTEYIYLSQELCDAQINYINSSYICNQYMFSKYFLQKQDIFYNQVYQSATYTKLKLEESIEKQNSEMFGLIFIRKNQDSSDLEIKSLFYQNLCKYDYTNQCEYLMSNLPYVEDLFPLFDKGLSNILSEMGSNYIQLYNYETLTDSVEIEKEFQQMVNSQNYFLNQIWGLQLSDHFIGIFKEFIINQTQIQLNNSQEILIASCIASGIILLIFIMVIDWVYYVYVLNLYQRTRQCLAQMPVATIMNKNIHQQLKLID